MTLTFTAQDLLAHLPQILAAWPEEGFRSVRVARKMLPSGLAQTNGEVVIHPGITRRQLHQAAVRLAKIYSAPWKYTKYFTKGKDIRSQAIKIRPGAIIPLSINGNDTTAYVNKARRIKFRGSQNYLKLDINLNTEYLPIILERESKCTCVYCGTAPISDEEACRACGAPLPC